MIDPNTPVPVDKLMAKLEPLQMWTAAGADKKPLPVRSVIFSTDLNWVIAGSSRGPMFAWKTAEPKADPVRMDSHNSAVTALKFNFANNRLASFDAAGHVTMWNPGNWAFLAFQRLPAGAAGTSTAYAVDNAAWIIGQRTGKIVVAPITAPGR